MRGLGLTLVFILVLVAVAPVMAQDAPKPPAAPAVSEVDALKLDKLLLRQNNLQLQIANLQAALQQANDEGPKLKAEVEQFIAGLQKPGFDLKADGKGGYVYAPKPPEPAPAPTPKDAPKK